LSGTIAANSYFLVQEGRGTGLVGTATDPSYNLTGGTLSLSASAGKIALFNSTATGASTTARTPNLVDLVGFGTTANFSFYAKTADLSLTTAAIRNSFTSTAVGTTDTFLVGAPVLNHVTSTPIPAAAWLLGSGLLGLVGIRRKLK